MGSRKSPDKNMKSRKLAAAIVVKREEAVSRSRSKGSAKGESS